MISVSFIFQMVFTAIFKINYVASTRSKMTVDSSSSGDYLDDSCLYSPRKFHLFPNLPKIKFRFTLPAC